MTRIRILLVDDQSSVRAGLRMRLALEPDLEVVGEAGDGREALRLSRHLYPDVVVMDLEMPGLDGVTTTGAMRVVSPHSRVVILSIHDDKAAREQAGLAGAAVFVAKQAGDAALLTAIRSVAGSARTE